MLVVAPLSGLLNSTIVGSFVSGSFVSGAAVDSRCGR
jgi:hypothetical protein